MKTEKPILARDIMTPDVIVAPLDMRVTYLVKLLRKKRISGLPVKDSKDKICGVVTVTDIFKVMKMLRGMHHRKAGWFANIIFNKESVTIKEIYTRGAITVLPDAPVEKIVDLMLEKNIHTIPVMNADKTVLYGVVGRHDLTWAALGDTTADDVKHPASALLEQ